MGAWGNGNFEQDFVLDFVHEVQLPLLEKARSVVKEPELAEADLPESDTIVAAVELLAILSEQANAAPPKPDEVALWKSTYLKAWDRTASDVYSRQEDVVDRRSVIAATFDRLAGLATRFHTQG